MMPPRETTPAQTPPDRGQTLDLPLSRPQATETRPSEPAPKSAPAVADKDEGEAKPE
jgi:hypothetical protein